MSHRRARTGKTDVHPTEPTLTAKAEVLRLAVMQRFNEAQRAKLAEMIAKAERGEKSEPRPPTIEDLRARLVSAAARVAVDFGHDLGRRR